MSPSLVGIAAASAMATYRKKAATAIQLVGDLKGIIGHAYGLYKFRRSLRKQYIYVCNMEDMKRPLR